VTLTTKPPAVTNSRTATVGFTVSEPATTACRLDIAPPVACTSLFSYTNLGAGRHTVTLTATDPAGNIGTATAGWTVPLPAATVSLAASAPTVTYGQAVTLTARVTVGTQPRANVAVRFCGPGSQACTVARTDKTGTARLTVKPDRAITYTAAVDAGADYGAGVSARVTVNVKPALVFLSAWQPGGGAVLAVVTPGTNQLQLQLWNGRSWVSRASTVTTPFALFTRLPHGTYRLVVPAQNGRLSNSGPSFRL